MDKTSEKLHPFLFVLGNPRSGTTLLRLALSAHSGICIPPECGFALWLAGKFEQREYPDSVGDFFKEIIECRKFETWGLTLQELSVEAERTPPTTYPEACMCVYRAFARNQGKGDALLGDKNNFYTNYVEKISGSFPAAKVIWIVRDPRDVFCSYLELGAKMIDSPYAPVLAQNTADFSREWLQVNGQRTAARSTFGRQFHMIRFEDLVSDPKGALTAACEFLGIPFEHEMLRFYESSNEPKEFLKWKEKTRGPFDGTRVGRFREDLDSIQIDSLNTSLYEPLVELGYQMS